MIKRFVLHFGLIIIFFMSVNNVNSYPSELESINEVNFNVLEHFIVPIRQGIYEFNATIQNTGDPLTPGTVPILWEKVYHTLYFKNTPGKGTLNETYIRMDLNNDGDDLDTFNVTWYPTTDREYDAIVTDGINDIHAYSLCEGPPADPWSNQSCYLEGKLKVFQLGTETHFLYFANSNYAVFGLCETILLKHPSSNFQLRSSSNVVADNFTINGVPVKENYSRLITHYGPSGRTERDYILPNPVPAIGTGDIITFSCLLKVYKNITVDITLQLNWSPDSNIRYRSVLVDENVNFIPLERPIFNKISSSCTPSDPGIFQLQAIFQNTGGPATQGTSIWGYEKILYNLPLTDGKGVLRETELNLDLNGDGNKIDEFEVKTVPLSGNFWCHDALIDGTYAHSIRDYNLPSYTDQFHDNNKSRHFTLENESHFLYYATEDEARFGFYSSHIFNHPSPFFRLIINNNKDQNVNVSISDLRINGEEASIAYTWITEDRTRDMTPDGIKSWTIPIKTAIQSQEVVDFSCDLIVHEPVIGFIVLIDYWTPYGDIFLRPDVEDIGNIFLIESTLTDSTTFTTTDDKTSPGFSFLAAFLVGIPLLALKRIRKRS